MIRAGLEALRSGRYQLGMFFDGDGDRLDIYRGDGTYLSSSFVYAAILPEIRRRFGGAGLGVFADLKSNPLAIIEMARTGVTVDVIRNGHSQIKESLLNDSSRFGAVEESAHYYGACALDRMKNGMDLEATLMRRGLPFDVNAQTHLATDWFQVGQRVSQSENGLARWEVVGASLDLVEQAKREIASCVRQFGAGDEYQG